MPSKSKFTLKLAPDAQQVSSLRAACLNSIGCKLSDPIEKNSIISKYDASCQKRGILCKVATLKKGGPTIKPINYPTIFLLVNGCSMKPSLNHQYWVSDLSLDNVIVVLLKLLESFLKDEDVANLSEVNILYQKMVHDVVEFKCKS